MDSESEPTHLKTMPLLQAVFAFNDDDLIANRYGQVTLAQKYQLRHYYLKSQNNILWVIGITILGFFLMLPNWQVNDFFVDALILVIILILDGLLIADSIYKRSDKALELLDVSILKVTGTAILSQKSDEPNLMWFFFKPTWYFFMWLTASTTYQLRIGGQRFAITNEAFHAIKNGAPYCVYFARKKTPILSIEPIHHDQSLAYLPNARPTASVLDSPPRKKNLN